MRVLLADLASIIDTTTVAPALSLARLRAARRPTRQRNCVLKFKNVVRDLLPNWLLLRIQFRRHIGYWPNVRSPKAYSEILLGKLLADDGVKNARYADKVEVREFVKDRIGSEYLVPCVLSTSEPKDIASANLPKSVVVKSSSGSGMVHLINDTTSVEWAPLVSKFQGWLQRDYSRLHREKIYSHYPAKLLVEEMLEPTGSSPPADYKVFVFGGKAQLIQYISGRGTDIRQTVYFPDGRPMPNVSKGFRCHDQPPPFGADVNEIVRISEALAADLDFVRVDLYWVNNRVYFGELTFYPGAIRTEFRPREFDEELGGVWLNGGSVNEKWAG